LLEKVLKTAQLQLDHSNLITLKKSNSDKTYENTKSSIESPLCEISLAFNSV